MTLDPTITLDPVLISFLIGFFLYFDRRTRTLERGLNRIEGFLRGSDEREERREHDHTRTSTG